MSTLRPSGTIDARPQTDRNREARDIDGLALAPQDVLELGYGVPVNRESGSIVLMPPHRPASGTAPSKKIATIDPATTARSTLGACARHAELNWAHGPSLDQDPIGGVRLDRWRIELHAKSGHVISLAEAARRDLGGRRDRAVDTEPEGRVPLLQGGASVPAPWRQWPDHQPVLGHVPASGTRSRCSLRRIEGYAGGHDEGAGA